MTDLPPPGDPYYPPASPAPAQPQAAYPQPGYLEPGYPQPGYPQPGYPQPGYPQAGYPGAGYPQPGYPQTGYPYAYPAPVRPTNGLAIGAMVVSIAAALGLCAYGMGGYLGIVGAILGHVARRQIRSTGESGDGMAMAGVIVGWISTVIAVIATAVIVYFVWWVATRTPSTTPYPYPTY
jgi:hypothetical protein